MRLLLFLLMMVISAVGPWHYLTAGAKARLARRAHLENVAQTAAGVSRLLERHRPPSSHLLEVAATRIETRRTTLEQFPGLVAQRLDSPAPTIDELTRMGQQAGVDAILLEGVLASARKDRVGEARKRALGSVLASLSAGTDLVLEKLHLASSFIASERALPMELLRTTITVRGDLTGLVQLSERMLSGSEQGLPADLIDLNLERPPEAEWHRIGVSEAAPPLRLTMSLDIVVAHGGSQ